jgi:hypothetical protein
MAKETRKLTYEILINDIVQVLNTCDGDYITEIYNQICSNPIKYMGDSLWEETGGNNGS